MNTPFDLGDTVRLRGWFTDEAGVAVDPDAVEVHVKKPDGTIVEVTEATPATKEAVGVYHSDVVPDQHGQWTYRIRGTGQNAASTEGQFYVRDSAFD